MLKILSDYLNIVKETQYIKKKRHSQLEQWFKTEYERMPDYQEIEHFMNICVNESIKVSMQFLYKVLFPVYDVEIFKNNNFNAMKIIAIKYNQLFLRYKNNYNINLLEMAYQLKPDDKELLECKFEIESSYFSYTIHEVPAGVLYGANGATIEQTKENLLALDEFELISKKLAKNADELISECRYYYRTWIDHLENKPYNMCYAEYLGTIEEWSFKPNT